MLKRKKKAIRPSRLAIDQRIFNKVKGKTNNQFLHKILLELKKFDFHDRHDLIREMAEHPRLPSEFLPIFDGTKKFHNVVNIGNYISKIYYAFWMLGIFSRHYDLLKKFNETRTKISVQILKGDAVAALRNLALISDLSESWWGIETAVHINKELLGNDTKGHIKQLQESHSDLNVSGMTRDLLLLSESNSTALYTNTILGRIKEYKSSSVEGALEYGAVESCLLLPFIYDSDRILSLESLYECRTWSIFDQYLLFRNILIELSMRKGIPPEWHDEAFKLASLVEDWELKNVLTAHESADILVSEILEQYTRGDYQPVLQSISSLVSQESPKSFGLVEVYARSKLYTSTVGVGDTFFDKLADEIAKILMLDSKSIERAAYLHKIAVKFRGEAWAKSLLYHLALVQEWRNDDDIVEALRLQTLCLGSYNTPKARARQFQLEDIACKESGAIPKHRVLRYASQIYSDVIDASVFPIYSDYLKTQSRFFIEKGLISQALEFCINEYLKNPVSFDHLPIRQLCESTEEVNREESFDYISCLVIFDIYSRECDSLFDEKKTTLFEEYLDFCGTHQPSKIFELADIDQKIAYFLRYLCTPAQLDNLIQFASNDEVIHERVAIIDLLIFARAGDTEELRAEKDKVLETLFSEKLRAKIETGKLYVDVQALETHRRHIYVTYYEQAKSLEGGISLEPLSEDGNTIDSQDLFQISGTTPVAVASSEKSSILVKIFLQAVQDFALNENYGLDKYLSAEVRHIVFVTQLRSCFEKNELVTVQRNGEYLPNQYWMEKYDYVSDSVIGDLDICLRTFSHELDSILDKVNDRFRVNVVEYSSDHIFNFCPYHDRIVRISKIVNSSDSFQSFFKGLIAFMWELAIECARSAQQLINDVLSVEILSAVNRLEENIQSLKGNIAMADLMQAIRNARSDFKKEVELVLNWFRFVGAEDSQTFERLGVVIEAAVSSFQSMFRHKGKDLVFTQEKSSLMLNYTEARALFISLFTALENALRYGTPGTPVLISHCVQGVSNELVIANEIGDRIGDPSNFVAEAKAKWTNEYSNLSTAEGGTGLYKIYNLLTNASSGFGFDIAIKDGHFNAKMDLSHEYFDNRRQSA